MADGSIGGSIARGQRVFTCGHSFHWFVADLLAEVAAGLGIAEHGTVGVSSIGASRAIQHWDVPAEENHARSAIRTGEVDVLTLSCMSGPDEGIRKFARLMATHNPHGRVTLQELWLPEDRFPFDPASRTRESVDQFNASTVAELTRAHALYCRAMETHVAQVNAELGGQVVLISPEAQATLALRTRIIAGDVPGLAQQADLFIDAWGHPSPPLKVLSAYCQFAVIYRRSPVGAPRPEMLRESERWGDDLNVLLQELAWQAVATHPMSGVTACQGL